VRAILGLVRVRSIIRIPLADDHAVARRGLRHILDSEANWDVCVEATNGKKAVALAARHRPDVAILDLIMPGLGGFEAALQICAILPECEIAIVTLHDSDELN
jgi:DNA-binding NarL/FixJ family response regulator